MMRQIKKPLAAHWFIFAILYFIDLRRVVHCFIPFRLTLPNRLRSYTQQQEQEQQLLFHCIWFRYYIVCVTAYTVNQGDENCTRPISAHQRQLVERERLSYVCDYCETSFETAHRPLNHSVVYSSKDSEILSRYGVGCRCDGVGPKRSC